MTSGEFFLTVLITIIILGVLVFVAWRFYVSHRLSQTGHPCQTNDDCVAGNYCGGDNVCVAGTSGGKIGSVCFTNSSCEVGSICDQHMDGVNRCAPLLQTF